MNLGEYYAFIPLFYSYVRQLYASIECFLQVLDSSIPGQIWTNLDNICDSLVINGK